MIHTNAFLNPACLANINVSFTVCPSLKNKDRLKVDRWERDSPAGATLLHDLCPVVTRELAESVITVNYRPLHDLRIPQQETCLCIEKLEKADGHIYYCA